MTVRAWVSMVCIVLDSALTVHTIHLGLGIELNPLLAVWLMYGLGPFVAVKALTGIVCVGALDYVDRRHLISWPLTLTTVFMEAVVIWGLTGVLLATWGV